ncbi:hypothetical protein [Bathymodiolus japonicus methanotrophic gill symbiont]|nr:hypothetical protein [Bathymodiolus japonicus methanotrophic gill symbiont]
MLKDLPLSEHIHQHCQARHATSQHSGTPVTNTYLNRQYSFG